MTRGRERFGEQWFREYQARNTRFQRGIVNTDQCAKADAGGPPTYGGTRQEPVAASSAPSAPVPGTLSLPWPPTGNTAVRHANGAHYLRPEVIAYRDVVATLCVGKGSLTGPYRLHVHMSPPDARARDMDNALKTLNDALVRCGYLPSDAMTYMRELHVTTDDERRGRVTVKAVPVWPEAA